MRLSCIRIGQYCPKKRNQAKPCEGGAPNREWAGERKRKLKQTAESAAATQNNHDELLNALDIQRRVYRIRRLKWQRAAWLVAIRSR